jgi:hypothetical protein
LPNSKPLQPLVLDALGVSGLNTQSNSTAIEYNWLTQADNVMLDTEGRLTSRQGIQQVSVGLTDATSSVNNTKIVKSIGERLDKDGTISYYCGIGTSVYELDTSKKPHTLTAQSFTGTAPTVTDGNWQWASFNNHLYGVQRGHLPIQVEQTTGNMLAIKEHASYGAPSSVTTFNPQCIMADFGSVWVGGIGENKNLVLRSDNLQGHKWNTGTAGQIDLQTVWGTDEVVALASFVNRLVIFGKRNIAIYANPWDAGTGATSTFQLQDLIKGVGCIARDSVQSFGEDIIFLSETGVRSLARTTEKDTLPLTDLTKNVKEDVNRNIPRTDGAADQVKSVYNSEYGFYALTLGHKDLTFVLDFRATNQDGTPVVTKWVTSKGKKPTSYLYTLGGDMWVGHGSSDLLYEEAVGAVSEYTDYLDKSYTEETVTYGTQSACETAGGVWESTTSTCWLNYDTNYESRFKTTWMDFGIPGISKLLKKLTAVITGGKNSVMSMTWFRDYEQTGVSTNINLRPSTVGTPALWGASTSLYGASKFVPTYRPVEYKVPLSRSAKTMQLEVTSTVAGEKAAIQNITISAKTGKIR